MESIEGATAFVTGGASGIGLGIARALAEKGAKVAIADIRDDHLEEAQDIAAREGWAGQCITLELDVTDRKAVADALAETERRLGSLRILVNNAGVGIAGPIVEAAFPDWDWAVSVNLGGVVNGIVAGLPLLRAHGLGGHIVNTASLGALMPARATRGIYATTKAAVVGMSEHLRLDLTGSGIGVSVLLPGPTRSNIHDSESVRPDHLREGSGFLQIDNPGGPPPDIIWMDPLIAGRMTVGAIMADELYVVTHPEYLPAVRKRHAGIEQAMERMAQQAELYRG